MMFFVCTDQNIVHFTFVWHDITITTKNTLLFHRVGSIFLSTLKLNEFNFLFSPNNRDSHRLDGGFQREPKNLLDRTNSRSGHELGVYNFLTCTAFVISTWRKKVLSETQFRMFKRILSAYRSVNGGYSRNFSTTSMYVLFQTALHC